jgi:hypothetical protein
VIAKHIHLWLNDQPSGPTIHFGLGSGLVQVDTALVVATDTVFTCKLYFLPQPQIRGPK